MHGAAAIFPAGAYSTIGAYSTSWTTPLWQAWRDSNASGYQWPIRRVTFRQPSTGWHMDPQMAEHYFRGSDDLSFDFPQRADRPAFQSWDIGTSGLPLARKWMGDYSWIVTVAPPTNAARNGIATNPEGFAYDVSVVVFYKRIFPDNADSAFTSLVTSGGNQAFLSAMSANERAVKAAVVSTGLNGGELLLTDNEDFYDASGVPKLNAFEHLKSGHWIMLCGPHPNSSTAEPRFVMNWYQVIAIESDATIITDRTKQRLVTVRGPDWPWQPATSLSDTTNISNNVCVAICKGAVAVHTKSMRLEGRGSAFSLSSGGAANGGAGGDGGFGSSGNPGNSPPPYTLH